MTKTLSQLSSFPAQSHNYPVRVEVRVPASIGILLFLDLLVLEAPTMNLAPPVPDRLALTSSRLDIS